MDDDNDVDDYDDDEDDADADAVADWRVSRTAAASVQDDHGSIC